MSVLVYRSTELRDLTARRAWFALEQGLHDGIEVRGEDWTIPAKPGQTVGDRQEHVRVLRLHGWVLGTTETNWKAVCAELEAIFDRTLTPGNLVVHTPYLGVASTLTIAARTVNTAIIHRVPGLCSEYDVTLHAIGDPPDWS